MKYLVWLLSAVNVYLGIRAFLNVIHVLHTSKYSQAATAIFAVLFLSLGIAGFYLSVTDRAKLALLVALGPWVLAVVILFFSMVTGKYQ